MLATANRSSISIRRVCIVGGPDRFWGHWATPPWDAA